MAEMPPAYETAVGDQTLLDIQDFWPKNLNGEVKAKRCHLESFMSVLDRANQWLKENSTFTVLTCETIEKKVYLLSELHSGSLLFRSDGSSASKIKGLRLWLTRNLSSHPTQIGVIDTIPSIRRSGDRHEKYPCYETFDSVVSRFNSGSGAPGRILSIQTVVYSISDGRWTSLFRFDHLLTAWPDAFKNHKLYTLRVFYEIGPARHELIGSADFVPQPIGNQRYHSVTPNYTDVSETMRRAADWIKKSSGIRVTNIQTLDTKYLSHLVARTDKKLDTLVGMDYKVEARQRVLFIRISYVNTDEPASSSQKYISCRPMYPHKYAGNNMFETLPQLKRRLLSCLQPKERRLICAESLNHVKNLHVKERGDHSVYAGEWYDDSTGDSTSERRYDMLEHIRLYSYDQ